MVNDPTARKYADKYGLDIVNVTWEDNARFKNSCWGPCISDMTLQVNDRRLPVIRTPNFEDLTWDVEIDKIPLVVGNESGEPLRTVTLKEYLQNFRDYLHNPNDWTGSNRSLLADRDTHVIMSAQACFLPVPKTGEAKFNVAIFNYQSTPSNPAVLAIVATAAGTSAQVVECSGGAQKLYFNKNGEKCSFVGQRLSDFRAEAGKPQDGPMTAEEKQQNMIIIIQVPLKVQVRYLPPPCPCPSPALMYFASAPGGPVPKMKKMRADVEDAIVKVGASEGKFKEIGGLSIERDPNYPVRVTLQYYKATSNGIVEEHHIETIANQIKEARKHATALGSLVVGGNTNRPTEPTLPKVKPPFWWDDFWLTYGSLFPQWTKSTAAEVVFKNGRFTTAGMSEVRDRVIDILSADSSAPPKPVQWQVL